MITRCRGITSSKAAGIHDLDKIPTASSDLVGLERAIVLHTIFDDKARVLQYKNQFESTSRSLQQLLNSVGAGLSSSGALEVATAMALLAAWRTEMPGREIALLCQRAENGFVGARTGIMDEIAALYGRAGNALALDCRSLEWEAVPLPGSRFAWLLADTRVKHDLAAAAYNERRQECEPIVMRARHNGPDRTSTFGRRPPPFGGKRSVGCDAVVCSE